MYDPNLKYEFFLSVAHCSSSNVEKRHTVSPSVIVIGGGFAGIAAARALHDASFQVLINNEICNIYMENFPYRPSLRTKPFEGR